jgi:hypothetical protein
MANCVQLCRLNYIWNLASGFVLFTLLYAANVQLEHLIVYG